MSKPISENAKVVLSYLKENYGVNTTAAEVGEATGFTLKTIVGIVNGLVKRGLAERLVVEGVGKKVIQATKEGLSFDPDAETEEA